MFIGHRVTNKKLYKDLPKITETIRYRLLKFSGHIWRHDEEIARNLLFWMPTTRKNKRGRPQKTYIDQLIEDAVLQMEELKTLMANREERKSFINSDFPKRFDQWVSEWYYSWTDLAEIEGWRFA